MAERYVFRPTRPLYVYLRCRREIEDDDDASDAADAMFRIAKGDRNDPIDDAQLMSLDGDYYTFGDGFVVRIKTPETCAEVETRWKDRLALFAAWAIHDGKNDVVEGGDSIGQVASALRAVRFSSRADPVTQAFIVYRNPESKEDVDGPAIAGRVQVSWRIKSQSAFHFSNGRVVVAPPEHRAASLVRSMLPVFGRDRKRSFHEVVFDDGDGGYGVGYFGEDDGWMPYTY